MPHVRHEASQSRLRPSSRLRQWPGLQRKMTSLISSCSRTSHLGETTTSRLPLYPLLVYLLHGIDAVGAELNHQPTRRIVLLTCNGYEICMMPRDVPRDERDSENQCIIQHTTVLRSVTDGLQGHWALSTPCHTWRLCFIERSASSSSVCSQFTKTT